VAVNPGVVPPGLQTFSLAPAQMAPQYVMKLVPIPLGASMPVIGGERNLEKIKHLCEKLIIYVYRPKCFSC